MLIYKPAIHLTLALIFGISTIGNAQLLNIKNDTFWNTTEGMPIYSQGGGIFKFTDPATKIRKYYWYGVQYAESERYRKHPEITNQQATFEAVTCYTSTDLVSWTKENDVLTNQYLNLFGNKTWVGRLGVAFIPLTKQYAMFVQHGNKVLVTVSDTPTGNFKWHHEIDMTSYIGTSNTGDQTIFTDEDTGKSYLIYSYGRGRNKIYVSEIGVRDNKITITNCIEVFKGESREGNCMFKYNGKYYMCASNIYGWDASFAYFLVADNIYGPYKPTNQMKVMNGCEKDFAHISQTGFFVTLKGSAKETVIYCGDRWANFAGNGLGFNQWAPLSFLAGEPYFNSLSSWNLEEKTGKWAIADDNNYILNGSFEADRNHIPSKVKPLQEELTGWKTFIIKGNKLSTSSPNSPVLNYFNTTNDRKLVIGEKSLLISDSIAFTRKITQQIKSYADMILPDGLYQLRFKSKNTGNFKQLKAFTISGNFTSEKSIPLTFNDWNEVIMDNITITKGTAEIGFYIDGAARAACMIDDISLKRIK